MTDITLSPIPYDGGTIYTNIVYRTFLISSTNPSKWYYAFRQTSPNYTILGMATYSPSIKTLSPTVSYFQRAFAGLFIYNSRMFELSNSRILLYSPSSNPNTRIYDISSGDFVEITTGNLPSSYNNNSYFQEVALVPVSSNNFKFIVQNTSTSIKIYDVTYTDGGSIISTETFSLGSLSTSLREVGYKSLDSNTFLFYPVYSDYTLPVVYKYDISTDSATLLESNNIKKEPIVFPSGEILLIRNNNDWVYIDTSFNSYPQTSTITSGSLLFYPRSSITFGSYNFIMTSDNGFQIFSFDPNKMKIYTAFYSLSPLTLPTLTTPNTSFSGYYPYFTNNNSFSIKYDENSLLRAIYVSNDVKWAIQITSFE